MNFANQYQKPLGFQQLASFSTAQTLTVPATATMAIISVETNAIRWRDDGTAPTASVGMPVAVGQTFIYSGNLSAITFIPQTGSATMDVSYYA
jgi:hypothetical protein